MDCTSVDLVRKIPGPGWRWRRQQEHVRVRTAAVLAMPGAAVCTSTQGQGPNVTGGGTRLQTTGKASTTAHKQCRPGHERKRRSAGDSPPNRAEFHARVVTSLFRDAAQHNNNLLPAAGRSLNPDALGLGHHACR
jgi:hypothetical protein